MSTTMKKAKSGFKRTAFWNGKNGSCFPRTVQAMLRLDSKAKVLLKSSECGCESGCGSSGECGCDSGCGSSGECGCSS